MTWTTPSKHVPCTPVSRAPVSRTPAARRREGSTPGAGGFELMERRLLLSTVSPVQSAAATTVSRLVAHAAAVSTPVVAITSPANGAVLPRNTTVTLTATASEASGTITGVQFLSNGTAIGTGVASNGVYTFQWKPAVSSYRLTAVATDARGVKTTSAAVNVRVDAPPAVKITSPASYAVFAPGFSTTLTAAASDADGTVSSVRFYDNGTPLAPGTLLNGVWSVPWANAAPGSHALTAVATDNDGAATTSSPDNVRVNILPTVSVVSPAAGSQFAARRPHHPLRQGHRPRRDAPALNFFADGNLLARGPSPPATPAAAPTPSRGRPRPPARTRSPPSPPTTTGASARPRPLR